MKAKTVFFCSEECIFYRFADCKQAFVKCEKCRARIHIVSPSMKQDEVCMQFGEWVISVKREKAKLNRYGRFDYDSPENYILFEKYYDEWISERKNYSEIKKRKKILEDIRELKKNGYMCRLIDYDNANIAVWATNGKKLNYFATTGTISGYKDTEINGIDCLLALLNKGTGI